MEPHLRHVNSHSPLCPPVLRSQVREPCKMRFCRWNWSDATQIPQRMRRLSGEISPTSCNPLAAMFTVPPLTVLTNVQEHLIASPDELDTPFDEPDLKLPGHSQYALGNSEIALVRKSLEKPSMQRCLELLKERREHLPHVKKMGIEESSVITPMPTSAESPGAPFSLPLGKQTKPLCTHLPLNMIPADVQYYRDENPFDYTTPPCAEEIPRLHMENKSHRKRTSINLEPLRRQLKGQPKDLQWTERPPHRDNDPKHLRELATNEFTHMLRGCEKNVPPKTEHSKNEFLTNEYPSIELSKRVYDALQKYGDEMEDTKASLNQVSNQEQQAVNGTGKVVISESFEGAKNEDDEKIELVLLVLVCLFIGHLCSTMTNVWV